MVQIFDMSPTESSASLIGKSLGEGLSKNFERPEQRVQRGLLADAMDSMQGQDTFEGRLKTILPTLATTPGGSEILSTMMPLLQKQAAAEAYDKYYQEQQPGASPVPGAPQAGQQGGGVQAGSILFTQD